MTEDDDRRRVVYSVRVLESAAERGLESGHAEIVFGDKQAFERFTAVLHDEKVERPSVCGDGLERLRLFLPLHPLRGRPASRAGRLLAVSPRRRDQRDSLRLLIRRRRQQHALDQTENRRGRPNAQAQSEHGYQSEGRLLEQHSHTKTKVLKHLVLQSSWL